ncbi:hypothetical protein LRD18_10435 [Halorhodospira halochloris]|uniref:outer membrane protein n=1 Tax=Halorhodospira halochloris TaxID=1052 RepID=UPI001EE86F9B|nr:hypothetical protein [Halorhodospira halochloris]MCG5531272.1 hypothetical protein [Halorhodospira halochloris]
MQVDSFYFGGEIAYSFGMSDEDISDYDSVLNEDHQFYQNFEAGDTYSENSTTVEAGDGYSLSARAGYLVTPSSMVYAKVSYQMRSFESEHSISYTLHDPQQDPEADSELVSESLSQDEDFSGFGIGIGAEQQFEQTPLALRVEAMLIEYDDEEVGDERLSVTGDPDDPFETVDIPDEEDSSTAPTEVSVNLQAVYRF